jgi:hypothetical protein
MVAPNIAVSAAMRARPPLHRQSSRKTGAALLRVSGMMIIFRPNNGRGTRIEQLDIGDAPFDPARTYTIAAAGERDLKQARNQQATGHRAIEAVRRYLATHGPVNAALTNRKFIAQ